MTDAGAFTNSEKLSVANQERGLIVEESMGTRQNSLLNFPLLLDAGGGGCSAGSKGRFVEVELPAMDAK